MVTVNKQVNVKVNIKTQLQQANRQIANLKGQLTKAKNATGGLQKAQKKTISTVGYLGIAFGALSQRMMKHSSVIRGLKEAYGGLTGAMVDITQIPLIPFYAQVLKMQALMLRGLMGLPTWARGLLGILLLVAATFFKILLFNRLMGFLIRRNLTDPLLDALGMSKKKAPQKKKGKQQAGFFDRAWKASISAMAVAMKKMWAATRATWSFLKQMALAAFEIAASFLVANAVLLGWIALIVAVAAVSWVVGKNLAEWVFGVDDANVSLANFKRGLAVIGDWFKEHFSSEGWHNFTQGLSTLTQGAGEALKVAWTGAMDWLRQKWENFKSGLGGLGDIIKEKFGDFWDWMGGKWDDFKKGLDKIGEILTTGFKTAVNFFIDSLNGILNALRDFHLPNWKWLGPVAGASPFGAIRDVPRLASGGDIKSSGLAFLHAGERVIPAAGVDRSRTVSQSFGGNTIIVNGFANNDAFSFASNLNLNSRHNIIAATGAIRG